LRVRASAAAAVALCSVPATNADAQPAALAGPLWEITAIAGQTIPAAPSASRPTIRFGDTSAGGSSGCNSFGGKPLYVGGFLTIRDVVSTMRACGGAVGRRERQLYDLLNQRLSWRVDGAGLLTLTAPDGRTLTARRKP
jgi:heat shock protein HslJ